MKGNVCLVNKAEALENCCRHLPDKSGFMATNCSSVISGIPANAFLYAPKVESELSNGTTRSSQKKNFQFDQSADTFVNILASCPIRDPPVLGKEDDSKY